MNKSVVRRCWKENSSQIFVQNSTSWHTLSNLSATRTISAVEWLRHGRSVKQKINRDRTINELEPWLLEQKNWTWLQQHSESTKYQMNIFEVNFVAASARNGKEMSSQLGMATLLNYKVGITFWHFFQLWSFFSQLKVPDMFCGNMTLMVKTAFLHFCAWIVSLTCLRTSQCCRRYTSSKTASLLLDAENSWSPTHKSRSADKCKDALTKVESNFWAPTSASSYAETYTE